MTKLYYKNVEKMKTIIQKWERVQLNLFIKNVIIKTYKDLLNFTMPGLVVLLSMHLMK